MIYAAPNFMTVDFFLRLQIVIYVIVFVLIIWCDLTSDLYSNYN